jgi:hypothetical protein
VTIFLKGLEKIHECPELIPEGSEKLGMDKGLGYVNGFVSAKTDEGTARCLWGSQTLDRSI